ncbi:hypothetical protein CJF31_00010282 [Rutstroemia sp. NJR-2017a BVV2]|nr:hypothetical protein CJF31_00010282 [Rutstroemia sp. NJR-2017a BVV2]
MNFNASVEGLGELYHFFSSLVLLIALPMTRSPTDLGPKMI